MERDVKIVIRKSGDWYLATARGLPGVFSQGKSLDEVRENLADAIKLMLADGDDPGPGDAGVPVSPSRPPSLKAAVKLPLPETCDGGEGGNEPP
jgi:predicted RNase H-like HicB family nuclease